MATANKYQTAYFARSDQPINTVDRLHLFQGSFSPKKIARQFPLVAGLHRATDGALIGVVIVVAMMSAFTLHWQYLWTTAFPRLEITRTLVHRLTDSTATLERHLLQSSNLPMPMVPTKAINLLYLDSPDSTSALSRDHSFKWSSLNRLISLPSRHGY